MQQECGWFDADDNSSAALPARLAGDAGNLQNVRLFTILLYYVHSCSFEWHFFFSVLLANWLIMRIYSTVNISIFCRNRCCCDYFGEFPFSRFYFQHLKRQK